MKNNFLSMTMMVGCLLVAPMHALHMESSGGHALDAESVRLVREGERFKSHPEMFRAWARQDPQVSLAIAVKEHAQERKKEIINWFTKKTNKKYAKIALKPGFITLVPGTLASTENDANGGEEMPGALKDLAKTVALELAAKFCPSLPKGSMLAELYLTVRGGLRVASWVQMGSLIAGEAGAIYDKFTAPNSFDIDSMSPAMLSAIASYSPIQAICDKYAGHVPSLSAALAAACSYRGQPSSVEDIIVRCCAKESDPKACMNAYKGQSKEECGLPSGGVYDVTATQISSGAVFPFPGALHEMFKNELSREFAKALATARQGDVQKALPKDSSKISLSSVRCNSDRMSMAYPVLPVSIPQTFSHLSVASQATDVQKIPSPQAALELALSILAQQATMPQAPQFAMCGMAQAHHGGVNPGGYFVTDSSGNAIRYGDGNFVCGGAGSSWGYTMAHGGRDHGGRWGGAHGGHGGGHDGGGSSGGGGGGDCCIS